MRTPHHRYRHHQQTDWVSLWSLQIMNMCDLKITSSRDLNWTFAHSLLPNAIATPIAYCYDNVFITKSQQKMLAFLFYSSSTSFISYSILLCIIPTPTLCPQYNCISQALDKPTPKFKSWNQTVQNPISSR